MANDIYTDFEVNTIESKKGRALSVSKNGNLNLVAKRQNPDYDEKCKDPKDPAYYSLTEEGLRDTFKYITLSTSAKKGTFLSMDVKRPTILMPGDPIMLFPREWNLDKE